MNWDRNVWTPEETHSPMNVSLKEAFVFSNIRHTWGEWPSSGPYSGKFFIILSRVQRYDRSQ
jgi:hypothetical protein